MRVVFHCRSSRSAMFGRWSPAPAGRRWRGEKLGLTEFGVRPVSIDEGAKPPSVRRGSHDPAGIPDRRSPELVIGHGSKSICALGAHSEVRRPSVGHSCGVRRPAHNKRDLEAQQRNASAGCVSLLLVEVGHVWALESRQLGQLPAACCPPVAAPPRLSSRERAPKFAVT